MSDKKSNSTGKVLLLRWYLLATEGERITRKKIGNLKTMVSILILSLVAG